MRLRRFAAAAVFSVAAFAASIETAVAQTVLRDAEIEQWIKDYSYPIFKVAGIEPASVNILLIGDQSINAFAGGLNMGIHTGLLSNADTPNQVLGVIAHETGHIAGGHSQRSSDAMARASTPILLSLVLAAGAIAAGAPEAGMGILGLGQNIAIGEYLTYSRGQEATADQAALTYLEATGQSGRGLVEFFGKLRNEQIIRGYKLNPYLQSHPLANDRIAALEQRAKASSYYAKADTPEEIARLHLIRGKIRGFMQEPNVTFRQYPLTDQSDEAAYARAVAYYRNADIDKGVKEIDRLIAKSPNDPYFYELKGQMLFEFGRVADSVAPHRRSVELAPDKALLKINYGRALAATEDQDM
ncbi:MAG: M48 family metalloprotease, partial [Parvularculaceae bacterium]|nr:M48 family metalloprotease [Parvularculaceae bacterium]